MREGRARGNEVSNVSLTNPTFMVFFTITYTLFILITVMITIFDFLIICSTLG